MLIKGFSYVSADNENISASGAALCMLMNFSGVESDPEEITELFRLTFGSNAFLEWYMEEHTMADSTRELNYSCISFLLGKHFPGVKYEITETSMDKVRHSFLKRRIPLMVHGTFPYGKRHQPNSIILAGYLDDELIVHDPLGNAMNNYRDKYGYNMVYPVEKIQSWIEDAGILSGIRIFEKKS